MNKPLSFIAALFLGLIIGGATVFMFKNQIVRSALLAEPAMLEDGLQALDKQKRQERLAEAGDDVETPYFGAFTGNPNGDVTVVKYTDYNCGYCRKSVEEVDKLLAADKNIRVVYRETPILAESSKDAALWALAAAQQNKHFEFHRTLFNAGSPDNATLRSVAAEVGMDVDAAAAFVAAEEPAAMAELQRNRGHMQQLGFGGTPAFVIGNQILEGLQNVGQLQEAVAETRAEAS